MIMFLAFSIELSPWVPYMMIVHHGRTGVCVRTCTGMLKKHWMSEGCAMVRPGAMQPVKVSFLALSKPSSRYEASSLDHLNNLTRASGGPGHPMAPPSLNKTSHR